MRYPCSTSHASVDDDLDGHPDVAEQVLVPLEHPLGGLDLAVLVGLRELLPDLLEREGRPRIEQQGDEVDQALERLHARGIILSAMSAGRGGVRLRHGTVLAVLASRPGALELRVAVDGAESDCDRATPTCAARSPSGDGVVLNTTAVELGLGTGGFHLVVSPSTTPIWTSRTRAA